MSGNTYREKGRAVFLAAMMVLSVVAMTTAFAGGAAAQDGNSDLTVTLDGGDFSDEATVTIESQDSDDSDSVTNTNGEFVFTGLNDETYDITASADGYQDATDTVTIDSSNGPHSVGLSMTVDDTSLTVTLDGGDFSDEATVSIESQDSDDADSATNTNGEFSFTGLNDGETYDITASADGYQDATDSVTIDSSSLDQSADLSMVEESTDPALNPDDDLFFQGQEITVTNLNPGETYTVREAMDLENGEVQSSEFVGQMTAGAEGDDDEGEFTIDTDADLRGAGDYFVDLDDTNLLFEVTNQTLETSFDSDSVTANDGVELEIDSNRGNYVANLSADNLDEDDLASVIHNENTEWNVFEGDDGQYKYDDGNVTIVANNETDNPSSDHSGEIYFDSDVVDAGNYTFTVDVTDTAAQDTANITVDDEDVERSLVNDPFVNERGEEFNITIDLEDTSEADVVLGDFNDVGYEVGFNVEDDSEDLDQVNVTFNSYAAGSTANLNDAIYAQHDDVDVTFAYANVTDDSTVFVNENEYEEFSYELSEDTDEDGPDETAGEFDTVALDDGTTIPNTEAEDGEGEYEYALFDNRMASGQYSLNLGQTFTTDSDGFPELDTSNDKSFVRLTDTSAPGAINTSTAPDGASMSSLEDYEEANVTETDSIANQDYLLLTLEDAGLTGLVSDANGDVAEQLAQEDIYLEIEQADVPANQGDRVWNNSLLVNEDNDGDYPLDFEVVNGDDYEGEELILKIPYEELGDADNYWGDGWDESDVRALEEDDSFDWTLTYDENGDYFDEDTEVNGSFDITEREVNIGAHEEVPNIDGAELGGTTTVAPGTEITLVASGPTFVQTQSPEVENDRSFAGTFNFSEYEPGTEFTIEAEEPVTASDDLDAELVDGAQPIFNLETASPGEAEVGEDATLDVTVNNDGGAEGEVEVGVDINGEPAYSENVTIDGEDSWTESFDLPTDETGEVTWGVTAGDDNETGTLTVVESTGENPDNGTPDNGTPDNGEPGEGNGSDGGNGEEGDSTPGFGAAVAAIALLASALLAARRQD